MGGRELSGEERLIARYFGPLAHHAGALALKDDAAVLTPPAGMDLVLTADAVIGGVHFFPDDPPDQIACKALRVNLSDLAAKGAKPAGFLLTLAIPEGTGEEWLSAFAAGLGRDVERYACPLLGGDTDRTDGPVMVAVTAFGVLPCGAMVRRTGAHVGDDIFVTGTIGDAALGLKVLRAALAADVDAATREHLIARYRLPEPRNAVAHAIRAHASAAIDISDGLAGDLFRLCRASGVGAEVEVGRIPLSAAAKAVLAADPREMQTVLAGGDDYEVLATVPPEKAAGFRSACAAAGVAAEAIGRIVPGEGSARFVGADGNPLVLERTAFSHF
jgi:thiamine-monophosphate kinase